MYLFPTPDNLVVSKNDPLVDLSLFVSSLSTTSFPKHPQTPKPSASKSRGAARGSYHKSTAKPGHDSSASCLRSYKLASQGKHMPVTPELIETKPLPRSLPSRPLSSNCSVSEANVFALIAVYNPYVRTKAIEIELPLSASLYDLAKDVKCQAASTYGREPLEGAFFFETTAHIDTRSLANQKGLEDLIKSLEEKSDFRFSILPMDVQVKELKLRLGKPYVYMHNFGCEHLLIVRDVYGSWREVLSSAGEEPKSTTVWERKRAVHECSVCSVRKAVKVVLGSPIAAQSPSWYCEDCYAMAHYGCSGELLPYAKDITVFELD